MANKTSAASGLRLDAAVGRNLAIDVVAAGAASFFVAPFITTVDRAIIENASGKRVLSTALQEISLDFLRNPLSFIRRKEFLLIYGLYTATYLSANAIDTVCEATEHDNKLPKFVGTTAVNMGLCIAKDREFARMFGVIAPAKFPLVSVALFAVRDSMTVGASFVAPPVIASFIESNGFANKSNSNSLAQMLCPAIVQLVSTPLHLLSLDLYNRNVATTQSRVAFVSREYLKSTAARIGRIAPAFGFGGIGNKYFRENLRALWAA
ncbi:hypothetical protein H310_08348 [Aphanomyces invadans]|uniref:Uncharacterized protein n=1 Tax=Aphanomyces invadans TaxID=157072 RepID=A0A024TZS1_9STRA|nr:hypothetical protein H310_08348 [Aphanomyces invadans]ETV98847.1 hypothetical protein H310_08348 [Aphanomyces invadans]|eukprot:XP_008872275.1 hypothetical protein H310_08348 [Aphanomyces invadans]